METKRQPPAGGNNQSAGAMGNQAINQTQTGSNADVDEEDDDESSGNLSMDDDADEEDDDESDDNLSMEDGSDDDSRITAKTGDNGNIVSTDDMQEGEMANGEESDMGEDVRK